MYSTVELRTVAAHARRDVLTMIHAAGGGHTGGSLSALDILVALHFRVMQVDLNVLASRGFFDPSELETYGRQGRSATACPSATLTR